MKTKTSISLAVGILVNAIVGVTTANTVSIDLEPIVIGKAIDAEFDGYFEYVGDRYGVNNRTTIGRVMPPSIHQSERRAILEFDISAIPDGAYVVNAILDLNWYSGSHTTAQTNIYGFVGDGVLDRADVMQTDNLLAAALPTLLGVDVTSFVQNLVDNSDSHAGFLGIETRDGANRNYSYFSLAIDYVPEAGPSLDIKPGSCPNPLNVGSQGVLPVALLGTDEFDVSLVDLSTVRLSRADDVGGSVRPNEGPPGPHSKIEDVGTPFDANLCDCHELEGDGIDDLAMKFPTPDLAIALELYEMEPGTVVELVVTGSLTDGVMFAASDCVVIRGNSGREWAPWHRSRRGRR